MIAAMPFPPHKAAGIRVQNEVEVLGRRVAMRLYCAQAATRTKSIRISGATIVFARRQLKTDDYYRYYSWLGKLMLDWELAGLVASDIRQGRLSLLHGHTPEGVLIAILASMRAWRRLPIIADLHGPLLPELMHYKMIPNFRPIIWMFVVAEKVMYAFCSRLLVTSEGLRTYVSTRIKNKSKAEVFSDYVLLRRFALSSGVPSEIGQLKPDNAPLIMYAGTLKDYQGLDILLKALTKLKRQRVRFRLAILGDGGLGKEYYQQMTERLGIVKHCTFLGMVPHNEVKEYLTIADILVSPRKDNEITRGGFVSQLPEYMAMGKVIVATSISDCDKMLSDNVGILVRPNSSQALAEGIVKAIREKNNWKSYQNKARLRAKSFSWEENSKRLIDLYWQIIKENERRESESRA